MPGKAAAPEKLAEQDSFQTEALEPRLTEAQAGDAPFFYGCRPFCSSRLLGLSLVLQPDFHSLPLGSQTLQRLGCSQRHHQRSHHRHQRELYQCRKHLSDASKLNALRLDVPITVVLDNARYQKCKVVFTLAKALNIELLYLPSYSPHLNLIERLWKFVRNQCLYSKYYANFDDFKHAIETCIEQANTTHKASLASLLTLNFQSFRKVQISNV